VRKIDRRCTARELLHLTFRRKGVHLLRIELDLQVLNELLRIADLLLILEQLSHPLEVPLIFVIANATFLVLPMRSDAFLCHAVHLERADLYFEWHAVLADHGCVEGLVAVGAGHRNEVLDPTRHWRPGLMNDAQRPVTVLDAVRNDS